MPILWLISLIAGMLLWSLTSLGQEPDASVSLAGFCAGLPRPAYAGLERVQFDSKWFELYRVSPGVTAIYEPFQWQEVISYLIEGDEQALLFDTGNGIGDIAEVVNFLTEKPVSVLNSHTHYDHVGGNHAFDMIYAMETAFTRRRQVGYPNNAIAMEVSAQALCRPLPVGVTPGNHVGHPFTVTRFIGDGAIIDLGDRRLEVIHIPGHTSDSIALLDREAGLMWTGDSFYAGPIWLYSPETDLDAYANSLTRLIKEVPNLTALLPAHNTPWAKPHVLVALEKSFHAMLRGEAQRIERGEGMVEYRFAGEDRFSFLMRDEPLPYRPSRNTVTNSNSSSSRSQ